MAFHWEVGQAKQLLIRAVAEDPAFVLAYLHLMGLSQFRVQRKHYYQLAERHRYEVSKSEQRIIDALRAAFLDAEYERAISILSQLSDEYPDDPYLEGYIGIRYCWYLHNCEEATKHFKEALRRDPHFIQGYHLLGNAALEEKKYDVAEKYRHGRNPPGDPSGGCRRGAHERNHCPPGDGDVPGLCPPTR